MDMYSLIRQAIAVRPVAAAVAGMALVAGCVSGCSSEPGPSGNLSAVGWMPDGRVVAGSARIDEAARLWTARPDGRMQSLPFDYCAPVIILSVFAVPAPDRIGLSVWCAEQPSFRIVTLGSKDGRIEQLTALSTDINGGVYVTGAGKGYVEYGSEGCVGIAEISGMDVKPLTLRITVNGTTAALDTYLPSVDSGGPCQATGLARHPSISDDGRYFAFFLRLCGQSCTGADEFNHEWRVVVHDASTGRIQLLSPGFQAPAGSAVSDSGRVAISGRHDDQTGLWQCSLEDRCLQPRRVASQILTSPAYNQQGTRIVAITDRADLVYLDAV